VSARAAAMRLGLALASATAIACGHGTGGADAEPPPPAAVANAPSLYALHPALLDADGRSIGLDVFRGHPVIVSMFYGSCPSACPLLVSNVARVDAELPAEVRAQTRVLLVSFDAVHDTPAALQAVAAAHHLDPARWTLAAAGDDDARELAAALGISYHALPGGGFAHTSVITALDREGRPVARAEGPAADLVPIARALERAAH
jgi:protein SCO1/2